MSRLAAHFLGTFSILLDGSPLRGFVSAKARALLVYLLVERDTFHSRAHLANLLWPLSDERLARHSLRNVLFNLRRVLGPQAADQFLYVTRMGVRFKDEGDVYVDVSEFLERIAEAEARQPGWVSALERAAELYRGDFLLGFTVSDSEVFEDWRRAWQEDLHLKALEVLRALADYYEEASLYDRAIAYARRLVQMAPWAEEGHYRLMRLFTLCGQRALALAQYKECARILAEEFNTTPSHEITALYERIKRGDLWVRPQEEIRLVPPVATGYGRVPTFVTPFVGRKKEIALLAERLRDPQCRLVTVIGMGGTGKSRIAFEVANQYASLFRDGFAFIPLSAVESPAMLPQAIADALKIPPTEKTPLVERIASFLADREMLLILDSFEHLTNMRAFVLTLLEKTSSVKILITSREPLHLYQEWVIPLTGLSYPPEPSAPDIERYDAIRLFVAAARRVRPDFTLTDEVRPWVVRICKQVQGSPLAIELATSWLQMLTCRDIAEVIEQDLDFLSTTMPDVPERHRSMRVVFDHSWAMLDQEERRAFRQLSVFHGPFTATAARSVANVSLATLARLVEKSLLTVTSGNRYSFHPLLRQYGQEQLSHFPEEKREVEERHATYMMGLLRKQAKHLQGPEQRRALDRIEQEIVEIRAAWRWLVAHKRAPEIVEALAPLQLFYDIRGRWEEGYNLFKEAESVCGGAEGDEKEGCLARIGMYRGWFALRLGRPDEAQALLEKARAYISQQGTWQERAFFAYTMGLLQKERGKYEDAIASLQESIALSRQASDPAWTARGLLSLLHTLDTVGEKPERLQALAEEALAMFRALGDPLGISLALSGLANCLYRQGMYEKARAAYEESIHIRRTIGDRPGIAVLLVNLGSVAFMQGRYAEARRLFEEAGTVYREIGSIFGWGFAMLNVGTVAEAENDLQEAARYYLLALNIFQRLSHTWGVMMTKTYLADVYVELEREEEARRLLLEALDMARELQAEGPLLRVLTSVGHLLLHRGDIAHGSEILSFVLSHPYAHTEVVERIERLLTHPSSPGVYPSPDDLRKHTSTSTLESVVNLAREALSE